MWRSQEERWKSEYTIRKSGMEDLFAVYKSQVSVFNILRVFLKKKFSLTVYYI